MHQLSLLMCSGAVALAALSSAPAQAACSPSTMPICTWSTASTYRCDMASASGGTGPGLNHIIVSDDGGEFDVDGYVDGVAFHCDSGALPTSAITLKVFGSDYDDQELRILPLKPSAYGYTLDIYIYGLLGADHLSGHPFYDTNIATQWMEGNGGDDHLDAGEIGSVLRGGGGEDEIRGSLQADDIRGGLRDDIIEASDGEDTIDAGGGDDQVWGGEHDDVIYGGDGNDIIYGGAHNDQIDGGAGADTLFGGDGDDTIRDDVGLDFLLDGGDGADWLCDHDPVDGSGTVDGGAGDDVMFYASPTAPALATGGSGYNECSSLYGAWAGSCVYTVVPSTLCDW